MFSEETLNVPLEQFNAMCEADIGTQWQFLWGEEIAEDGLPRSSSRFTDLETLRRQCLTAHYPDSGTPLFKKFLYHIIAYVLGCEELHSDIFSVETELEFEI